MANSLKESSFQLYYDDSCPLCLKTIRYIKKWVKPIKTEYVKLSESKLDKKVVHRAYNEMLLVSNANKFYWGYFTYSKMLKLSITWYSGFLWIIGNLMHLPVLKTVGIKVYLYISSNRIKCTTSSCIL